MPALSPSPSALLLGLISVLLVSLSACQEPPRPPATPTLHGSWQTEEYRLKEGSVHEVRGRIFFTEQDWTVLFFVMGDDGTPQRGSGEGGLYTLNGDSLTFTHEFHLSSGEAVGTLAESPLRMEIRDAADAPREPCTINLDGDHLTLLFPSGNAMTFRRRTVTVNTP